MNLGFTCSDMLACGDFLKRPLMGVFVGWLDVGGAGDGQLLGLLLLYPTIIMLKAGKGHLAKDVQKSNCLGINAVCRKISSDCSRQLKTVLFSAKKFRFH